MKDPIAILGVGVVAPVGLTATQTAASIRAGIARFGETSHRRRDFEPIVMALVPDDVLPPPDPMIPGFPGLSDREVRMLRLAGLAAAEATNQAPLDEPMVLMLGLPDNLWRGEARPSRDLLNLFAVQTNLRINFESSKMLPHGRAAGIGAVREAVKLIELNQHAVVLVGGMDTYLDEDLLARMDDEGRIYSSFSYDGFIPGEGAGFLLLGLLQAAERIAAEPLGFLEGVQTGWEKGHKYSDEPFQGEGLAGVLRNLCEDCINPNPVSTVYAGFNGENFNAKEWGVAFLRNHDYFAENLAIEHSADCFGDTGAAMGPIMTVLSLISMQRGYRRGPCLVWCTSDHGACAALRTVLEG
jgi:3-oxoacyl-[acyl-carrier-protein] synthase-1